MLGRGGAQVQPMVREEGFHMQGYGQRKKKERRRKKYNTDSIVLCPPTEIYNYRPFVDNLSFLLAALNVFVFGFLQVNYKMSRCKFPFIYLAHKL